MRLYMLQSAAGQPAPRFIRLWLEQDLLGSWELIRETGQLGGKSQLRRELFNDRAQGMEAFENARSLHLKRGFVIPDEANGDA